MRHRYRVDRARDAYGSVRCRSRFESISKANCQEYEGQLQPAPGLAALYRSYHSATTVSPSRRPLLMSMPRVASGSTFEHTAVQLPSRQQRFDDRVVEHLSRHLNADGIAGAVWIDPVSQQHRRNIARRVNTHQRASVASMVVRGNAH